MKSNDEKWLRLSEQEIQLSYVWNLAFWYGREYQRRRGNDSSNDSMGRAKSRHLSKVLKRPIKLPPHSFLHDDLPMRKLAERLGAEAEAKA